MANSFIANQPCPIVGLGTYSFTVETAGIYELSCQLTIPCNPSGSSLNSAATDPNQSNVEIALKNGSTSLITAVGGSANNPTPSQGSISASTSSAFAAGDIAHVILTSSNAIDSVPNNVKGTINFYYQG